MGNVYALAMEGGASMADIKNSIYWNIFGDAFALMKKNYTPDQSGDYWQAAMNDARAAYGKYAGTIQQDFAKTLILAVMDELENLPSNFTKS